MAPNNEIRPLPPFLIMHSDGVTLAIKVQPRAKVNGIDGVHGDELKMKVTAPPVDAAANAAVVRLFAELLGCGRSDIEIIRGETSRHKVIRVRGVDPEQVASALARP